MGEQKDDYRLGYRPDVEGLRAIAILLVVAAHARVPFIQGGFVGVDVFYILSGYLITGLLVQEVTTTGRLRFANFYARRLRRLLPALFLMVAVTCIVASFVAPPTQLPIQASNASGAVAWLSNFQFAFWDLDYFAPSSSVALFLHTWSLGVEEQFYLAWPLLVVLAASAWKRASRAPNPARLKWLFVGIFVASYALSLYWTYHAQMFAFYLMPSRAWQFALGAIVFLLVGSPTFQTASAMRNSGWLVPLGWIGLAMILVGARIIGRAAPYPGTWALLPSFGAALVLAAGAHRTRVGVQSVLSWRPIQALGRVSYSWYLWHWPVLGLGAQLTDTTDPWNRLFLALISLGIAALSYHFFETPIRHWRTVVAKPRFAIVGALVMMIIAVGSLRVWMATSGKDAHDPALATYIAAASDKSPLYRKSCFASIESVSVHFCSSGNTRAKHTLVVVGDSKAIHWVPALRQVFNRPDWRVLITAKSGCAMVDSSFILFRERREYTECARWRADAISKIAALHPDVIVLSESIEYPFSKEQWISGTQHVLRTLAPLTRHFYLMRPTPELPFNGSICAEPRSHLYNELVGTSHCTAEAHTAHFEEVNGWLHAAAAPFRNVRILDMTDAVCPRGLCRSEIDGVIVFADTGHMTQSFVRTLAPKLAAAVKPDGLFRSATPKP